MKMKVDINYKTQNGLLKAIHRNSEKYLMTTSVAWWFQIAKTTLIDKWGWTEKNASKYIAAYIPRESAYRAHG